jgi:hypothetical protein
MILWEQQGGRCAITNIAMTHKYHDMCAASIDRIDSSKGHVKGNVQLLCQAVNHAKRHHSQGEVISFFDLCYKVREESEYAPGLGELLNLGDDNYD